ncbi:p120 protein [Bacteroidales bacterium Barb6]|nr:p120 protein [Bacteroidales bacterium Barb6]
MNSIEQLYKEWQSCQPLKPEDQKRLDDKFKLEFNYNSNHIEGNTLTYGQTRLLLWFGNTSGSASLRDYEEMKAHDVGLKIMMQEALDKERLLSEKFIRDLNSIILVENYWKDVRTPDGIPTRMEIKVGTYKSHPNFVITETREELYYASPEETPAFMTALIDWYRAEEAKGELPPVELAALLHFRYIRVHPFEDGNGRIARLLVNYVLLRHGYPMIIIKSEDKQNYIHILNECDNAVGLAPSDGANAPLDKIQPLTDYLKEQLLSAFHLCLKAAKGESIEEEDDYAKRLNLLEREINDKKETIQSKQQLRIKQIGDIIEYFYYPFARRIVLGLKPSETFFLKIIYEVGLKNESNDMLFSNDINNKAAGRDKINFISNAGNIFFRYTLKAPKQGALDHLSIVIGFYIELADKYYTVWPLDNKIYRYGTFPSKEDEDIILSSLKAEVLKEIEDAVTKHI